MNAIDIILKSQEVGAVIKPALADMAINAPFRRCPACGKQVVVSIECDSEGDRLKQGPWIFCATFPCDCLAHRPYEPFYYTFRFPDTVGGFKMMARQAVALAVIWNTWPTKRAVENASLFRVMPLCNAHRFTTGKAARDAWDALPVRVKERYPSPIGPVKMTPEQVDNCNRMLHWFFDYANGGLTQ